MKDSIIVTFHSNMGAAACPAMSFIKGFKMEKYLVGTKIKPVLNTYWANPSPLSRISMLRRWIVGDGEAGAHYHII